MAIVTAGEEVSDGVHTRMLAWSTIASLPPFFLYVVSAASAMLSVANETQSACVSPLAGAREATVKQRIVERSVISKECQWKTAFHERATMSSLPSAHDLCQSRS